MPSLALQQTLRPWQGRRVISWQERAAEVEVAATVQRALGYDEWTAQRLAAAAVDSIYGAYL